MSSELRALYQEVILDHGKSPRNLRRLVVTVEAETVGSDTIAVAVEVEAAVGVLKVEESIAVVVETVQADLVGWDYLAGTCSPGAVGASADAGYADTDTGGARRPCVALDEVARVAGDDSNGNREVYFILALRCIAG